jgi:hypothetical protein
VSDNVVPVYCVFIRIEEEKDRLGLTHGTILNSFCMLRVFRLDTCINKELMHEPYFN